MPDLDARLHQDVRLAEVRLVQKLDRKVGVAVASNVSTENNVVLMSNNPDRVCGRTAVTEVECLVSATRHVGVHDVKVKRIDAPLEIDDCVFRPASRGVARRVEDERVFTRAAAQQIDALSPKKQVLTPSPRQTVFAGAACQAVVT